MNGKLNLFNKQCFYRGVSIGAMCDVNIDNDCSKCSLSALTQAQNRFATRLLPCR